MVHHFEPTRYHTTIGTHEPALRVKDGDTVITTTVDARGKDRTDKPVTPPGNPQTGPFHVEGAEPGDTLAVHLDRLTPNRPFGWTRPLVAANVLDPDYVRETAGEIENPVNLCLWEMDLDRRTVTLVEPGDTRLGRLTLPMAPMAGCFGVAPPGGQAISTATSSSHGGNMDYRGFVEGVTVYFPVFASGALFHIGDGHALQGDGEIVGTGIEISFDAQFTFRLLKGEAKRLAPGEKTGTTCSRPATPGHSTSASSMRPRRCCAGYRPTTASIPGRPTPSSASASSTTWATCTIQPTPWCARSGKICSKVWVSTPVRYTPSCLLNNCHHTEWRLSCIDLRDTWPGLQAREPVSDAASPWAWPMRVWT